MRLYVFSCGSRNSRELPQNINFMWSSLVAIFFHAPGNYSKKTHFHLKLNLIRLQISINVINCRILKTSTRCNKLNMNLWPIFAFKLFLNSLFATRCQDAVVAPKGGGLLRTPHRSNFSSISCSFPIKMASNNRLAAHLFVDPPLLGNPGSATVKMCHKCHSGTYNMFKNLRII